MQGAKDRVARLGFEIIINYHTTTHLCDNIRSFPTEQRLVEHFELQSQLSHVVGHSEGVGEGGDPIHDLLVGVRDQSLSERAFAITDEVENPPDRIVREKRLLVKMHYPVSVREYVHTVFQAVLKGTGFKQSPRLRTIRRRHHDLPHSPVMVQADGLVRNHLNEEVLQAGINAFVHVSNHVRPNEFRIVPTSHYSYTDEGRQERRAFQRHPVGEGVVECQPREIEQRLRQREECYES